MPPKPASKWIPVEKYAADVDFAPSEIVSLILDGVFEGRRVGNLWYVAKPLVSVEHPDQNNTASGLLKISACKIGRYVTAGRGELGIPLHFADGEADVVLKKIDRAMKKRPVMPLEVVLGGESFIVDSSLWVDLGAALLEFKILNDPESARASNKDGDHDAG
jgi:hypothetical protein